MPLTAQGKRTLEDFTRRYGPKKGNTDRLVFESSKAKRFRKITGE